VQSFVSLGAAGLSAQRRHLPFGLKEGRARCTTSSGLGSKEKNKTKEKQRKNPEEACL
jgi:hypothetical protein